MRKKIIQTMLVLCLLCGFFVPIRVHAAGGSYTVLSAGCYDLGQSTGNGLYNTLSFNSEVRAVALIDSNNWARFYFFKDESFMRGNGTNAGSYGNCPSPSSNAMSYTVVSGYYYYNSIALRNYDLNGIISYEDNFTSDSQRRDFAYSVTYGASAVDPEEPPVIPNWGLIDDVSFSTSIAGSGSAGVNNIDHIKWNPEQDTEGNVYDGQRVEIKAIPGTYTAASKTSLLTLGVSDFDYDSSREHIIGEFPVSNGQYDVSWSDVISMLRAGSISDFLGIHKSDDVWLKSGWIYQIRLLDYAENGDIAYEGQWQTIYTGTSSGVQNSLNIENSNTLNMALINTIQEINTNNNTVVNWEIGDVIINMENQDGTETTDKPWWAYLLEAIVKAMGDLLAFLGNLIGDLLDGIVDLFRPTEFTINEYNDFKIEIKQNSGLFGQAIDFTNDLKNTFLGVQYQEPILHWQGISFGETVFIPAADYNLNEYVTMWGLGDFRQLAYLCSDGFIFFSLLLLIIQKLNEVLKR